MHYGGYRHVLFYDTTNEQFYVTILEFNDVYDRWLYSYIDYDVLSIYVNTHLEYHFGRHNVLLGNCKLTHIGTL